jgi:16S rRNA (uracil1498-N3)-methyltransferase
VSERHCVLWPAGAPVPVPGLRVTLEESESRHLIQARRVGGGEQVWAITGAGEGIRCKLHIADDRRGIVEVLEVVSGWHEPAQRLTLCLAMIRPGAVDGVITSGTALGLHRLVLLQTRRVVRQGVKGDRWRRLAAAAAKQCGRGWIPVIEGPLPIADLLRHLEPGPLLVARGAQGDPDLGSLVAGDHWPARGAISLVIGPEGDLDETEHKHLLDAGAVAVSLGPRRLRSEDAALAGLALLLAGR